MFVYGAVLQALRMDKKMLRLPWVVLDDLSLTMQLAWLLVRHLRPAKDGSCSLSQKWDQMWKMWRGRNWIGWGLR